MNQFFPEIFNLQQRILPMNRRLFLRNSIFTAGALSLTQKQLLAALFQESWKINMLRGNVGIFEDRGGGTIGFLLGKKDVVVVDSQFPEKSTLLIEELKKRSDKPIKLLINTHHHRDHSSGNISFKGIVDHVLAHENSRKNQENYAKQN
jgi:glyoxylase-like metal-dependent hydrolase (beta-lactamase superfamily II)